MSQAEVSSAHMRPRSLKLPVPVCTGISHRCRFTHVMLSLSSACLLVLHLWPCLKVRGVFDVHLLEKYSDHFWEGADGGVGEGG